MKARSVWAQYEDRLRRVSAYIHDHLDDELDMGKLAEIACLSPWHWHRIYKAVHDETAIATVRRLRLHRAAWALAQSQQPIRQIAKRAGYPNVQSFTRTFRDAYGQCPAQYRKAGIHTAYQQATRQGDISMFEVEIKVLEPIRLIGLPHTGPYMEIGRTYAQLWQLLVARQMFQPGMCDVAVYYDNPEVTAPDELRSFAAVSVPVDVRADEPLVKQLLPGGDHAVLLFKGPYAGLHAAYEWLYGVWLPQSGRSIRGTPDFEIYLNNPTDTPADALLTQICLPLTALETAG